MPSAWLHEQALVPEPIRLRPQKLEKRILRLHDAAALRKLFGLQAKQLCSVARAVTERSNAATEERLKSGHVVGTASIVCLRARAQARA